MYLICINHGLGCYVPSAAVNTYQIQHTPTRGTTDLYSYVEREYQRNHEYQYQTQPRAIGGRYQWIHIVAVPDEYY